MDPRAPFSVTRMLDDDDGEERNSPQPPSFAQFLQPHSFSQFSQLGGFSQFHQSPGFSQPASFSQFPQPAFDFQSVSQWQHFQQWQQFQQILQKQQSHVQVEQHVEESPSKSKAENKKKKKEKIVIENDEQPSKVNRQKWPQSDEVLLAQAMISISENPIIGNNQTGDAYWNKIETYYNDAPPIVSRDAHNLRSHWHMFKSKVNRFNDLYLQVKSCYRSGWSDDQYLVEARLLYINDPSNKTSAPFTYEHVWNVVKDHGKYNSATKVHGFQAPKRSKTNSSGGYASSASDANFGDNPEMFVSLEDGDDEQEPPYESPSHPIGRDKAKAKAKLKGKATEESSEYELKKLSLIHDLSLSNKVRTQAIEKFEKRIDKFLELKQKKMEIEERKLLFIDTSHMNSFQRAEHEAVCNEIRKKYGYAQGN
ncbi:hypothetical protein E3N88_46259 [Mikania micrantha]|uniref:No apical meristem-associated C-terminal domain-containing protein n=1 Tax=Mikania micrantha TaxID=192012 RepID=A0A5N6L6V3_9ASTR|nr:hypothetical protein E3N88_46259 [Mikania micrantha]